MLFHNQGGGGAFPAHAPADREQAQSVNGRVGRVVQSVSDQSAGVGDGSADGQGDCKAHVQSQHDRKSAALFAGGRFDDVVVAHNEAPRRAIVRRPNQRPTSDA